MRDAMHFTKQKKRELTIGAKIATPTPNANTVANSCNFENPFPRISNV